MRMSSEKEWEIYLIFVCETEPPMVYYISRLAPFLI